MYIMFGVVEDRGCPNHRHVLLLHCLNTRALPCWILNFAMRNAAFDLMPGFFHAGILEASKAFFRHYARLKNDATVLQMTSTCLGVL